MPDHPGAADPAGREAMRRRLYARGASPEDVVAYAQAVAAQAPPAVADVPARSRRGRLRLPAVLAAGTALAAAAALVPLLTGSPADRSAARSSAPQPVETAATSVPERIAFVRGLAQAGSAGVGAWLDQHGRALPGALGAATRSDTLERTGDGTRLLRLDPPSIGDDGGKVTVLLVTGADARVRWRLLRGGPEPGPGLEAGARAMRQDAGELTLATVAYRPGLKPDRLQVVAPSGVRWSVAAVFSD